MLQLIRQIAPYGAILIEARYRRWWVACEVKLSGEVYKGLVKTSNEKLYFALKDLLVLAREELLKLASDAGKLGYESVADVKRFVEEADKIKVAQEYAVSIKAILHYPISSVTYAAYPPTVQ